MHGNMESISLSDKVWLCVVQMIYLQAVYSSKTSERISSYPGDTISIKPPKIFKHVYSKFTHLMSQHAITRAANIFISAKRVQGSKPEKLELYQ